MSEARMNDLDARMITICRHYINGDFLLAKDLLQLELEKVENKHHLIPYLNFLSAYPPHPLSAVVSHDPFFTRHLLVNAAERNLRIFPTNEKDATLDPALAQELFRILKAESDPSGGLMSYVRAVKGFSQLGYFAEAEFCLQRSMDLAIKLDSFEFAVYCQYLFFSLSYGHYRLTGSMAGGRKQREQWLSSLEIKLVENGQFLSYCKSLVEFELQNSTVIANWLNSSPSLPNFIPFEYYTDPTVWRHKAIIDGFLYIQLCTIDSDFSAGSKTMDRCLYLLRENLSDAPKSTVHRWLWTPNKAVKLLFFHFVDPFDQNAEVSKRKFVLWEFVRFYRLALGASHPTVALLESELSALNNGELPSPLPEHHIALMDESETRRQIEYHSNRAQDKSKSDSLLRSYIEERWNENSSPLKLDLAFHFRGADQVRLASIVHPKVYSRLLTPDRVASLIRIVKEASGKFYFGCENGSGDWGLQINKAFD